MKYIYDGKFGWDHEPYWLYLRSVQGLMPEQLFEFASNSENHNLNSPNSLHDSWLEYWHVKELLKSDGTKDRFVQIDACFLGPRHDRRICLTYKNVEKHTVQNVGKIFPTSRRTPHGDLLVHELVVVREGMFSHELIFSKGTAFTVQFADFEHRVELI